MSVFSSEQEERLYHQHKMMKRAFYEWKYLKESGHTRQAKAAKKEYIKEKKILEKMQKEGMQIEQAQEGWV